LATESRPAVEIFPETKAREDKRKKKKEANELKIDQTNRSRYLLAIIPDNYSDSMKKTEEPPKVRT